MNATSDVTASKNVVLITGASSGLGLEMARQFAAKGYDLALCARSYDQLVSLAEELSTSMGIRARAYAMDVADSEQQRTVMAQAVTDFGKLDIVIANAGLGSMPRIGDGDHETLRRLVDTNILGLMITVDLAVTLFRQQGFGQIVGLSSVLADRPATPGSALYSASKAAVSTYMDGVALETRGENIDVTVIAPGYIDTPMNRDAPSRPFVVPVERGVTQLVDRIERKARYAYVPWWPWAIVGRALRVLPSVFLPRR